MTDLATKLREERLAYLERQFALVPAWVSVGGQSFLTIETIGGNILATGETGVKWAAVSSVPSQYDPQVDTSFCDGIGVGYLKMNGAYIDLPAGGHRKVLIVNDSSGGFSTRALLAGDTFRTVCSKQISVAGGGGLYVEAFLVNFI
jgi:hypothetical protein